MTTGELTLEKAMDLPYDTLRDDAAAQKYIISQLHWYKFLACKEWSILPLITHRQSFSLCKYMPVIAY